jgi:hypothetical protein
MSKSIDSKLELDKTREGMLALGLEHGAAALSELISRAVKDELAPHRFLDELLSIEIGHREERRVRTSLRLSALPVGQTHLRHYDVERCCAAMTYGEAPGLYHYTSAAPSRG